MRTLPRIGGQQVEGGVCVPGCLLYDQNPRNRLQMALRPLGVVFLIACFAAYLSHTFQSDMTYNASEKLKNGKLLEDNKEDPIDTEFRFMEKSASDIISSIKNLEEDLYGMKSVVKGGLNPVMLQQTVEIVKKQLQKYDADKTGITDYALENLGGCILSIRDTVTYKEGTPTLTLFGVPIIIMKTEPRYIIQPKDKPGDCWAIKGSRGCVVIQLIEKIVITAITIEHIPRALSPTGDISSAPREVSLYGLIHLDDEKPHKFGTFVYDNHGPAVQIFDVQEQSSWRYGIVEVRIESNHGHPQFTCIYRIRIHGRPPGLKDDKLYLISFISIVIFCELRLPVSSGIRCRDVVPGAWPQCRSQLTGWVTMVLTASLLGYQGLLLVL